MISGSNPARSPCDNSERRRCDDLALWENLPISLLRSSLASVFFFLVFVAAGNDGRGRRRFAMATAMRVRVKMGGGTKKNKKELLLQNLASRAARECGNFRILPTPFSSLRLRLLFTPAADIHQTLKYLAPENVSDPDVYSGTSLELLSTSEFK